MEAVHLAVRTIDTSADTETITRAVVVIQGRRPATVGIGITTITRLETIRVIRRAIEPIIEGVDGVAILLPLQVKSVMKRQMRHVTRILEVSRRG
jgi:hypothetical protein